MEQIPVIDFGMFESDPIAVASQIRAACETIGFLYLTNVGIPQTEIDGAFRLSASFFDQPLDSKNKFARDDNNKGYIGPRGEMLDPSTQKMGENKECFNFGKLINGKPVQPLPAPLDANEAFLAKFSDCHNLCGRILQAFAVALEIKEKDGGVHYFEDRHKYDVACGSVLRFLKYPKGDNNNGIDIVRCGSHSDYGSITLLFQNGIPGLEVQASRTHWISAPVIHGAVLVNIGDQMEYWTGGRFKSTKHRVVHLPEYADKDRLSIAYFCQANDEVLLDAIPSGLQAGSQYYHDHPVKSAGQYLQERLDASYNFFTAA
ncbi:hypothetical protein INT43_002744 [Umbelopsis isabellina]|uniref:Fe2OG dioxygenase domain-containing protein n=1 Tax=Mortierella isabellina TaxID=91625 RepID=A0A8H7UHR2_MORIS|nr:hypothetical protein INT43_002744 [Umbelopsis isabellina]